MLILNYHRVGLPPRTARYRGMYVSPQMLRWHVQLLKWRGKRFVTLSEGVRAGCPADAVALTFDDGYVDNFAAGLPVLKSEGVPATVFVVTKDVGKSDVIWSEAGDQVPSDLMNWQQLKDLTAAGWEVGSHAADHVHLARRNAADQRTVIQKSWDDFQQNLGHPPSSFAYPYGSFNDDSITILTNLGCVAAVTTKSDGINTALTHPLKLYRIPAKGHSLRHALRSVSLLWKS